MQAEPEESEPAVPRSARVWNYWLGGTDNLPVDRAAGDRFAEVFPGIVDAARGARGFLTRAVHHLAAEAGVRQFLDIGSGLPTADNTHEIAQRAAPEARVVYVDNDPIVLSHARALLTSTPEGHTAYMEADLLDPGTILDTAAGTLDLTRPVGLMLLGVLGHVPHDDVAQAAVARLLAPLPPGSYLALSDGTDVSTARRAAHERYNSSGADPYRLRSSEWLRRFFYGLELLDPGVVPVTQWRPEPGTEPPAAVTTYGGVARKP